MSHAANTRKRNIAECVGNIDVDEQLIEALIGVPLTAPTEYRK